MKLIAFLLLSLFAIIISAGCDSSSCGTTGTCVNSNMCNCGSNFSPTDSSNAACAQGTCTPNDYSQASHLVPISVYNPALVSSFSLGAWDINLKYAQAQKVSRNVKIFSGTGALCKEFVDDLGYLDSTSLPWDQSIDATNGGSDCLDVIQANLPWTNVSACLRDGTDPNIYQGNIVSYTSLSGVDYNQTQYSNGAKKALTTTQFSSSKGFSFDFQASITTGSEDYNFTLAYGTIVTMLLNTTDSTSKNASCLLDLFATTLNYSRNLFLVDTDIDVNSSGFQFFKFLVLDSSQGASQVVGNAIIAYTNATVVSCNGVSTISVNISTDYQQILFRVVSNTFDAATLKLTLVYDLRITAPIKADSAYTTSGDTLSQTTITIGGDTCDSDFCDQTITVVVDLTGMDCNGISKNSILTMNPVCKTNGIQTLCDSYLAGINGRKINVPIVFAAKWCPIQEKTELSKNSFRIYASGSDQPLADGAVINDTRSVTGKITINIDSKVTNSVLGSANITQLILSDGTSPFLVSVASITQDFVALTNTFVVTFNHTIDPAVTAINFKNSLFYVATVDAVFSVPGSKKSFIGRKVVGSTIPVSSQSSQFKMGSLASTSTTAPPSKTSSSSVVEMAMGVWVSMIALFCLMMF